MDLGQFTAGISSGALLAAADFSRIRNADLARFTVDRLMSILNRLGSRIEVKIGVRRKIFTFRDKWITQC